jgi:plastocyanin
MVYNNCPMEASRRHNALAQFLSRIRTGATPAIASIAGLLVTGAAYMLALAGTSSAATVGVEVGNTWFCNSTFDNGVCDTTVTVGDTVSWDVVEGVHTVTECDDAFQNCGQGGRFDSGNMNSADPLYEQTFSSPGIYEYLCTLHELQMKGRVVVSAATPSTTATLSPTPTPSPTLTSSPTPSPTPFSPYVLQTIKDIGKPLLTDIALFPSAPHLGVVTTQDGDLWKVDLSDPLAPATAFGNVRDRLTRTGDEGLLSVTFEAADPHRLYINYTTGTHYYRPYNNGPVSPTPTMPANPKRNRVARYDIAAGVMSVASEAIIYESLRPGNWHTLGDLAFDGDGNLNAG